MKKLLLFIAGLIISVHAYSQIRFLGSNERTINDTFIHLDFTLQERNVTVKGKDKVISLIYYPGGNVKGNTSVRTFILKNDTCKSYMVSDYLNELPKTIAEINKTFTRVDENNWIDEKSYYQATLTRMKDGFYIEFKIM